MTMLGVSCMDQLNVLGGFFVSRRRFGTIEVPTKLGVTSHGAEVEIV